MKRSRGGWRTIQADPAKAGALLREAGFVGCAADPVSVRASFDGAGQARRIHARYEGGWSAVLYLGARGACSLTQSISIVAVGRSRG